MKKFLLLVVACAGVAVMYSCKPSKEEIKKSFIKKCTTSIPGNIPKDIAAEYCSCSADALLAKYSVEEIAEMEKKIQAGDESVKNKMMEPVKPCIETMAQKAQAQQ